MCRKSERKKHYEGKKVDSLGFAQPKMFGRYFVNIAETQSVMREQSSAKNCNYGFQFQPSQAKIIGYTFHFLGIKNEWVTD